MNTAAVNDPKPGLAANVRRAGLIKNSPTATNRTSGISLLTVNISLARADHLTPTRLIPVRKTTSPVMIATLGGPDSAGGQNEPRETMKTCARVANPATPVTHINHT